MGGQDGDFGYLHVLGCGGHIEADIGICFSVCKDIKKK